MGFPPIGIMSLSSVLKRAGHEVTMFDQANPDTPNEVIIDEMRRQKPDLVGMSFLSTTSYPYAKMLARQLRAADANIKLAFGGVFATLNAQLVKAQCTEVDFVCRGDGEQLIVDLLERLERSRHRDGRDLAGEGRHAAEQPEPRAAARPRPVAVPGPREPGARFRRVDAARRPGGALARPLHHDADVPRLPVALRVLRHPDLQRGQVALAEPPRTSSREFEQLRKDGYGSVYFVDDHFLLQPKRIEAICDGLIAAKNPIKYGLEGRVDSVAQHLFPKLAKSGCRTVMFGIESGSQKILDRLKKEQTLAEIESAVGNAKAAGIEIVHGFFVVGIPDETEEDLRATFKFASKIRIDSFGFNRLCVYRGTPLWQEYVKRGLVNDATDWYKYFKCTSIDPTCLPGEEVHRIRQEELRKLILYKFTRYPIQTFRLLRRFVRFMPLRDVLYLVAKPFLGKKAGATNAEVVSRAVEHADAKSAAADMTSLADEALEHAIAGSKAERARIRAMAEAAD